MTGDFFEMRLEGLGAFGAGLVVNHAALRGVCAALDEVNASADEHVFDHHRLFVFRQLGEADFGVLHAPAGGAFGGVDFGELAQAVPRGLQLDDERQSDITAIAAGGEGLDRLVQKGGDGRLVGGVAHRFVFMQCLEGVVNERAEVARIHFIARGIEGFHAEDVLEIETKRAREIVGKLGNAELLKYRRLRVRRGRAQEPGAVPRRRRGARCFHLAVWKEAQGAGGEFFIGAAQQQAAGFERIAVG